MPLSAPAPRQLLHQRIVQCSGYRREDGLWDIEGRMVDTKTYPFPNEDRGGAIQAGEPLHDMWIRLTVDDQFQIHDVEARTDAFAVRSLSRHHRPLPATDRRAHRAGLVAQAQGTVQRRQAAAPI